METLGGLLIMLVCFAIVVGAVYGVYYLLFKRRKKPEPVMYCNECGYTGTTVKSMRGSLAVEFVLWLFFAIPGLIYSLWRRSTRKQACSNCKSRSVIPASSPKAKAAVTH